MKIITTGGTGFIGKRLIKRLILDDNNVLNIGRNMVIEYTANSQKSYKFNDEAELFFLLDQFDSNIVIHLATSYQAKDINSLNQLVNVNIKFPLMLMHYLKDKQGSYFLNVASYWEFSSRHNKYKGVNPYAITKSLIPDLLEYYKLYRLNYNNIYLYGSYGEGDTRKKILDLMIDSVNAKKVIKLSPGEQKLNLVHVDDIVNGLLILIDNRNNKDYVNRSFSLFDDEEYSLKELAELIKEVAEIKVKWGALPYRPDEVMQPEYIFPKLLGWSKEVSIKNYVINRIK